MLDARKGKFKFDIDVILQKCVLILKDKADDLLQSGLDKIEDSSILIEIIKSKISVEEIDI